MRFDSARNGEVLPTPGEWPKDGIHRRTRRPDNDSAARRRALRSRRKRKSSKLQCSSRQLAKWQDLRKWENLPKIQKRDAYPVELLITQAREGRLRPYVMPETCALDVRQVFVLSCITLACLVRGARAVWGTRVRWGALMGVGGTKAYELLRELLQRGWLERLPQFKPHVSTGRDGEKLNHRQQENMYRPGPKLREAWRKLQNERSQRFSRSLADGTRLPSLRSKSIEAFRQKSAADPARALAAEGKVAPAARSIGSPPLASTAPASPPAALPSSGDPNFQPALVGLKVAAFGGGLPTVAKAAAPAVHPARNGRLIPDEDKALLDHCALDIQHARALWKIYLVDPGDGADRQMALRLARLSLAQHGYEGA